MKNKQLIKTNLLVSVILIFGFLITAFFSYRANYQESLDSIERVSSLTTEGIYYQFTTMFTRPVNISLTMAHDSLLMEHLSNEDAHLEDEDYVSTIQEYLENYKKKYDFDSVFLVSSATRRYYNFNGVDRVLTEGEQENEWYFDLMKSGEEYSLNVDNDEVDGADNAITVFVNCKIYGRDASVLGVVGVGIRVSYLKEFLAEYEKKFNVSASLIDTHGIIEISTTHTGYGRTDWFEVYEQESIRREILGWERDDANLELWTQSGKEEKSYVVSRYIPELSWHLVVQQNNGEAVRAIKLRVYQSAFIIAVITLVVLLVITTVIRHFNKQVTQLMQERQDMFQKATEQLYDHIYELNITANRYANLRTAQYFESLGAKDLPYDQGLRVIAEKQIQSEYREGYVSTFTPENVLREYEAGNNHLSYDFPLTQDGASYHWMRIDAYIFLSQEDQCIHMFTYRKNIDGEKQKELLASTDEMTGFLTKMATERKISSLLSAHPEDLYALFLFDIDNFKRVNDQNGHAFGDFCIREFTAAIQKNFREKDLLGRVGGDEFAAFIPVADKGWVENKAKELSRALDFDCTREDKSWHLSASIGVAVTSPGDTDFDTLFQRADTALYRTKQRGKNGFTVFSCEDGIKSSL